MNQDNFRVAIIDTETTGLSKDSRIVELGVVVLDGHGNTISEYGSLVNPDTSPGPTHVHGITEELLVDAPRFHEIAGDVLSLISGSVIAGHNVGFDIKRFNYEISLLDESLGISIDWGQPIDTLSMSRKNLAATCAAHGVTNLRAHSALEDARATGEVLCKLRNVHDVVRLVAEGEFPAKVKGLSVLNVEKKPLNREQAVLLKSSRM